MNKDFPVWIVVPCYNEEKRLGRRAFAEYLSIHNDVGFCFVNDGSKDGTIEVIRNIRDDFPGQVALLDLGRNYGKAEAVRSGVSHVSQLYSCRYIGFWDADLATPLEEIDNFLKILSSNDELLVASGSRISRMGACIERTPFRYMEGKFFAALSSAVLGLKFRDTQCGAKLFEKEIALRIFAEPLISRWCFDVELFARIRDLMGHAEVKRVVYEVPLQKWKEIPGSKMDIKGSMGMILDLGKIFLHYGSAL